MTMQTEEAPVDVEVLQEIQNHLGSLEADYRANVPEGTVIAEANVQGGIFNVIKGSSLAKLKGKSLPGRTLVYDTRTGMTSKVPTRSLMYQLGKRRADGSRVYSLEMPQGITPPTPIDDTCKICLPRRNGVKRNFYSEYDLLSHYQLFHTLEWNAMERDRDIKERREDASRMERLITNLATALRPDLAAKLPEDVREQITSLQEKEAELKAEAPALCDECGFEAKNAFGLQAHKRNKHGGE